MLFSKDGNDWNACVGDNGLQDDWIYYEGYSLIPQIIYKHLKNNYNLNIDELIYPYIYCARHSIELFFKEGIKRINNIRNKNNDDEIEKFILSTHSIKKIWDKFCEIALNTDRRFISYKKKLESYIIEIEMIDAEGQTFRYSSNVNGNKNLLKQNTINVNNFFCEFIKINNIIKSLRDLILEINDEYSLGTYTKILSRRDIEIISLMLPPYSLWNSQELPKSIAKIKKKFKISQKECDRAIDIIKNHNTFKSNIEFNCINLSINKKDLLLLLSANKKIRTFNISHSYQINLSSPNLLYRINNFFCHEIRNNLLNKINQLTIFTLYKLYYIGSNNILTESHNDLDNEIISKLNSDNIDPLNVLILSKILKDSIYKGIVLSGHKHELSKLGFY